MSLLEEVRILEAYERIILRDDVRRELNEIFKLKPEAAKEKAKQKLKQLSDDIKKAIEKHGEDSKTVLYLRAKKKQFAHAMGESDEMCPEGEVWDEQLLDCVTKTPEQPEVLKTEQEEECPEGQQWCPVQKKCVEPGRVQARMGLGPGRARGRMAEDEQCPEGQIWDDVQEKCVEPGKDLKMADEGLAIPKGASVETIANFLQKEFGISKARAMKQAKEYKEKIKTKGFHHFESEELSEAQMKKKYGGKDLKFRFHYGMDLSELINLVRHKVFEELTRPGIPTDPKNKTHYNKVFTSVMNEVQWQLDNRTQVALKDIRKVLPEIVIDALTIPEVK